MQRNSKQFNIMEDILPTDRKREAFKKVATKRVQRILDTLALLSNCANKNNYSYSEEDVSLMFSEIEKALKTTKDAFNAANSKNNGRFRFSD